LSILFEAEIESISEVQRVKYYDRESEGAKGEILRSDNGGEYTSIEFKVYLASKGIEHQLSVSGRPE